MTRTVDQLFVAKSSVICQDQMHLKNSVEEQGGPSHNTLLALQEKLNLKVYEAIGALRNMALSWAQVNTKSNFRSGGIDSALEDLRRLSKGVGRYESK